MTPRSSSPAQAAGAETRAKIIAATLQTLRDEGIVGASARAIARTGGFNQALIFYHFGSVTDLLVAAAVAESAQRAERYEPVLAGVSTLPELVRVARELHELETEQGGLNVLTQLMAGAASSPELQRGILDAFAPWMTLVQDAVARVLTDTPYADIVPIGDMSFAIAALFVGVELLHNLDPERGSAPSLFSTFEALANVLELLIRPAV
jgi:AcrR family transcriptional regulator